MNYAKIQKSIIDDFLAVRTFLANFEEYEGGIWWINGSYMVKIPKEYFCLDCRKVIKRCAHVKGTPVVENYIEKSKTNVVEVKPNKEKVVLADGTKFVKFDIDGGEYYINKGFKLFKSKHKLTYKIEQHFEYERGRMLYIFRGNELIGAMGAYDKRKFK